MFAGNQNLQRASRFIPFHPIPSHPILCYPILSHPIPVKLQRDSFPKYKQVSVSPMKGKVAPEETVPFMVTLKASVHASFYSMDLVCKVGPPSERSWDGTQLPS